MQKFNTLLKNTEIKVCKGDITNLEESVDAIVNAANTDLILGAGVAGAILKNGGYQIQEECNKLSPIAVGDAVITSAGKLKYKNIIHAAVMGRDLMTSENYIRLATKSSLNLCEENRISSIAFPALGCGVGGFLYEKTARIMAEVISDHIINKDTALRKIIFVIFEEKYFSVFTKTVMEHIGYVQRKIGSYPVPTVDIIIEVRTQKKSGVVLIERSNPPYGWAIPGGFVEYGESLEETALREAEEETSLKVRDLKQMHVYSKPGRDPRFHTIATVFIAKADTLPKANSDAKNVVVATEKEIIEDKYDIVFDHKEILKDYFAKYTS